MNIELYNKILELKENEIEVTGKGRLCVPKFNHVCYGKRKSETTGLLDKCNDCLWLKNAEYHEYYIHELNGLLGFLLDNGPDCSLYTPTEIKSWEMGGINLMSQEKYEKLLPEIVNLYLIKRKYE